MLSNQFRFKITKQDIANMFIDLAPMVILIFTIAITIAALMALVSADPLIGGFTMMFMSGGDPYYGGLVSLATTGLVIAGVGTVFFGIRKGWEWWVIVLVLLPTIAVSVLDMDFDGLAADFWRYGKLVEKSHFASDLEWKTHLKLRWLLRGISLVGDTMAGMALVIFPVIKELIQNIFSDFTNGSRARRSTSRKSSSRKATDRKSNHPRRGSRTQVAGVLNDGQGGFYLQQSRGPCDAQGKPIRRYPPGPPGRRSRS